MVIFALEFHRNFGYRDLFYYFVRFFSRKKIAGAEEEKTGAGFARFARKDKSKICKICKICKKR